MIWFHNINRKLFVHEMKRISFLFIRFMTLVFPFLNIGQEFVLQINGSITIALLRGSITFTIDVRDIVIGKDTFLFH